MIVGGRPRVQPWRIPSRSDCLACHTPQAGFALSFDTRQLNLAGDIHGFAGNQLELLRNAGYFTAEPEPVATLPRHFRPDETRVPIEQRARSYLAVNCASCHRAGGTANPATWDARPELALADLGLVNVRVAADGGDPAARLVAPGLPAKSILIHRVAGTGGFGRMPPLGTAEVDTVGVNLLRQWVSSLPVAPFPVVTNPGPQLGLDSEEVSLPIVASHRYGAALAFTAAGLPPGVSIDPESGVVSGAPTAPGLYRVAVTVTQGSRRTVVRFDWRVKPNTGLAVEWTRRELARRSSLAQPPLLTAS